MKRSKELEKTAFSRGQQRILLIAALFPFVFYSVAIIRRIAEYYFRLSQEYHYIYSTVSGVGMLIQVSLMLFSVPFALYVLIGQKIIRSSMVITLSILLCLLPLISILIS